MFWKNKEKIKQEKLEKLYEEVEDYLEKIYHYNFEPNMDMFRVIKSNGDEEFVKSFKIYFAGYDSVHTWVEFRTKICNGFENFAKPTVLMDYIHLFKDKKINYVNKKLSKYIMTKLDGTIFEVDAKKIDYEHNNVVHWNNGVSEFFQKMEPVYTETNESTAWGWTESVTFKDIQNHFIDFKTEEEKILKEEI